MPTHYPGFVHLTFESKERVSFARRLCRSSPPMVVQRMRTLPKNGEDNSVFQSKGEGAAAALAAVGELLRGEPVPEGKLETWRKLVDAGITDALIFNALKSIHHLAIRHDTTQQIIDKATSEMRTPYYAALEILSNASRLLDPSTPTPQDQIFMSTMRTQWSAMIKHIWGHAYTSLGPEKVHVCERVVLETLFLRLVTYDPSFLLIAYNDLTIPLFTQHWAKSGRCPADLLDAFTTSRVLYNLHRPQSDNVAQYMKGHQDELSPTKLLSLMCKGVSTERHRSETAQVQALVDTFVTRLALLNGRDVKLVMDMSLSLLEWAIQGISGPQEYAAAVIAHDAYWHELFDLIKRIHKGEAKDSGGEPTDKRFMLVAMNLVSTAFDYVTDKPESQGELLRICGTEGLFDVLDEVMEEMLAVATKNDIQIAQPLAKLFFNMWAALPHCSPRQRKTVAAQFPRWRTLHALVAQDAMSQQDAVVPLDSSVLPPAQAAWQMFLLVATGCKHEAKCTARGCNRFATAQCGSCKVFGYCGPECQRADWKGHKILCKDKGLMGPVRQRMETPTGDMDAVKKSIGVGIQTAPSTS